MGRPMSDRDFRTLRESDGYALSYPEIITEFRVERLRRDRDGLHGEVTVSCGLPACRSTNGVVSVADLNFSSARAGQERGKIIAERAGVPDVGWSDLLEEFRQRVMAAERIGEPAVLLRDMARPTAEEEISVHGIRLLRRHPVILFGDGGSLKSYLALWQAGTLALNGVRVLLADWELSGEDHRDRLERLFGSDMPDVLYARCDRPLTSEADRLRRIVADEHVEYLIVDSIVFALNGPPESAEVAGEYFRALRRIGVGSLSIAHITKAAENSDQKPFGSTFFHNGARSTFYIKRSDDAASDDHVTIGVFQRKGNLGPLAHPVGFDVTFGPEQTTFERSDVVNRVDLAGKMPVWQQMAALLRQGSKTLLEIATDLDLPIASVTKAAQRGEGKSFTRFTGPDGVYRIGLLSDRDAA